VSTPERLVLAGTNGAGKSSIAGAILENLGAVYYNPDTVTRRYIEEGLPPEEANSRAWRRGVNQLDRAIRDRLNYAFETTLGGHTITQRLIEAAKLGVRVRIWYVGLATSELHIARVKARVARGGHDIPELRVRERYNASRENLVRLLPHLYELTMFDNSQDVRMNAGDPPEPLHVLHLRGGRLQHLAAPTVIPAWCKPIVAAAVRLSGRPNDADD